MLLIKFEFLGLSPSLISTISSEGTIARNLDPAPKANMVSSGA